MKTVYESISRIAFGFLTCTLLLTVSCQNPQVTEVSPDATSVEDSPAIKYLLEQGFKREDIEDEGRYYVVEKDILFDKKDLPSKGARHAVSNQAAAVSINIVNSLNVSVRRRYYTEFPDDASYQRVVVATQAAISYWNNIPGSRVHFNYVTLPDYAEPDPSQNIINVQFSYLPSTTYGRGEYPISCRSGNYLLIASQTLGLTDSQLQFVMAHELGHCLGFRHTEEGASQNGFHIPGTPLSETASVMTSPAFGPTPGSIQTWNGFSAGDQVAAATLYPVTASASAYFNQGYIYLDWTISNFCQTTIRLEVYKDGSFVSSGNFPNNGRITFIAPSQDNQNNAGTYSYRIINNENPSNFLTASVGYYF
jgi:hypothetical protein